MNSTTLIIGLTVIMYITVRFLPELVQDFKDIGDWISKRFGDEGDDDDDGLAG